MKKVSLCLAMLFLSAMSHVQSDTATMLSDFLAAIDADRAIDIFRAAFPDAYKDVEVGRSIIVRQR